MSDNIEWRSLDVTAAEGMSLRVGTFLASDGEPVEFTQDVLKKVFSKVTKPVPMYLTHKDAGTGKDRVILGHAVKLGITPQYDSIHFKALMMDPTFKLMYASGYDDTSAEITPIRDEATGRIVDGVLTGFAVVPNPAISGTEMKVSAIAFSTGGTTGSYVPTVPVVPKIELDSAKDIVKPNNGGIKLTGKTVIERTLLESGVPADKLDATVDALGQAFSKKFEQAGLQKKFEDAQEAIKLACSERDEMKKKFEDLNNEYNTMLSDKVAALSSEIKTIGFANAEAIVEGLDVRQKIATLSKMKEGLATSKPMTAGAQFQTQVPPAASSAKAFQDNLTELGVADLWNKYHKGA
jgi:hypothetical protein